RSRSRRGDFGGYARPLETERFAAEFLLLGPLEARVGGRAVALGGPRQRTLLAALALAHPQALSRDSLVEEVWGPLAPASAAHAVEVYVSRLRERLGAGALVTRPGPVYALAAQPEQIDARRFERLAADGAARLHADPQAASAELGDALALWRGAVLADLVYEGPARSEIARLEELRLQALEDRVEAELALGRHRDCVGELEALVAAHPLRERARAQLMLALYRCDRQSDALDAYREGRRLLVDELGLEPGPQLRELEGAILRQDPALAVQDARSRARRNLPAPATALVGRQSELAELVALLRGDARLVTLTGPGGSGKTRLSIEVADALLPAFADGVHFADLSALREPDLVAGTILAALKADPGDGGLSEELLAEHLCERRLLLVLDNFEQVDAAAPLVGRLLAAAPGLRALVTSRRRLRLYGEHEYQLGPLALAQAPDTATVRAAESVVLFAARALARDRRFAITDANAAVVADVTRRVEGLPLAIELVAARVGELSLDELVAGLPVLDLAADGPRDAPERHRALRATIDWSIDLLDDDQRRLFRRLGVFAGGLDAEAALAVAGAAPAALDALADRSLLRRAGRRWVMLATIGERAHEQLEQSGDGEQVRRLHAEHYLAIAEASEDGLKGAEQQAWGERVELEHDNLRAALGRGVVGDAQARLVALRTATGLGWFWYTHGHGREGALWLERTLDAVADAPVVLRGRASHVLGVLLAQRADLEAAEERFRAGLALFREAGDEQRAGTSLNSLAIVARQRGHAEQSRALFEQTIALWRRLDNRRRLSDPLGNLAVVAIDAGELALARELLEESLQIDREFGHDWGIALNLGNLGAVALQEGELDEAQPLLDESLRRLRALGDRSELLQALERSAGLAAARGAARRAIELAAAAAAQRAQLGETLSPTDAAIVERNLAPARAALSADALAAARAQGERLTLDEALDAALEQPPPPG
ncbi:MAG: hypothetical protein QOE31_915, partial [Solirubrobacteraceae bacterium]|nr:hypothetical protein [Solirubrobacteraceae bacterium]